MEFFAANVFFRHCSFSGNDDLFTSLIQCFLRFRIQEPNTPKIPLFLCNVKSFYK
jgi:hypothetical protein